MCTSHFSKAGIILMLSLAWSGMLFAQTNTPITTPVTKHINGYWEYLPEGYASSSAKYPLLIFLHGIDEVGNGSQKQLGKVQKNAVPKLIKQNKFPATFTVQGKTFSFIVICPQLSVIGRSADEIDDLITYMVRKYRVDESRIYLTGISLGGGTCMYYVGNSRGYAERVAAMVTASQNQNVTGSGGQNVGSTNLPLWMTHNEFDRKISARYTQGWYDYLTAYKPAMNPQPIMDLFPQSGHDAWTTTFNPNWRPNGLNVYEWMLQYTRGGEKPPPSDVKVHPVIKAPDTSVFNRRDPILLDGSGSYSDDQSRLFYKWEYVSGPGGFNITNPTDDKTYFYVKQAGQYVVKLTVFNYRGASASQTKTITVIERKQPVAVIKNDSVVVLPERSIVLDAGSSYDSFGKIVSFNWRYVSGPQGFSASNRKQPSLTLEDLVEGAYQFAVVVTNDAGLKDTAVASFKVVNKSPARKPPVAVIKNDAVIMLPKDSILLDAGGSYDNAGSIIGYDWRYISGPAGFVISNNSASSTMVKELKAGVYRFGMIVTNDAGLKDTALTSFTVKKVSPPPVEKPPVAIIKNDAVIVLPRDSILLDASTSYDSAGKIVRYDWRYVSGPAGFVMTNNNAALATIRKLKAGSYGFGVIITNDVGLKDTALTNFTVKNAPPPPAKKPPVALIKNDAVIVLPKDSISLDASASYDSAGKIVAYDWRYVSGPAGFVMSNNRTASAMIKELKVGVYRFGVIVTNDAGLKDTALTNFTVKDAPPVRKPPVAVVKNASVVTLPKDSIQLDASASYDNTGKIVAYSWRYVSGPGGSVIINSKLPSVTVDHLSEGAYRFEVIVTNDAGLTDTAITAFRVNRVPREETPPVAVVKNASVIVLPTNSISLDAGDSYDSSGKITGYEWRFISGPQGFVMGDSMQPVLKIQDLAEGFYRFGVIVTNDAGLRDTGFAKFSVKVKPGQKPVAVITNDALVVLPKDSIVLDASASYNNGGTITGYDWRYVFGPQGFTVSGSSKSVFSITGLRVGSYRFGVIVTNSAGLKDTAITNFVVKNGSRPPRAPVAIINNESVIVLPKDSIVLDAGSSYDSSGSIAGYDWRYVFGPEGFTASVDRQTLTLKKLSVGSYRFGVIVRNNFGLKDTAITNFVVKYEGANILPVAVIKAPSVISFPQQTVTLDGSASFDPDGRIASYQWEYVSGPSRFTAGDDSGSTWTLSNLSAGLYVFKLTVKDDQGGVATAIDSLQVTSTPIANRGPVAVIKAASEIMLPDNSISLDGTSSYDPDGHIKYYTWKFVSGPPGFKMQGDSQAAISVSDLVDGEYSFMLIVTDDKNNRDSALFSFVVKPQPVNAVPFAIVNAPSVITLPDNSIELDGSGSYDPDGSIQTYLWSYVSGPTGYAAVGLDKAEITVSNLVEGYYKFKLSVTDNAGKISDTVISFIVKRQNVNIAPIAVIQGDSVYNWPLSSVELKGDASYDPDGSIKSYSWRLLAGPNGAAVYNSTGSQVRISALAIGYYKLELRVTDNKGQSAASTFSFTIRDVQSHPELIDMFVLAPVPAVSTLNVRLSNDEKGKLTVRVTDFNGKIVFLKNYDKQTSTWQQTIDVANYATGVYFVDVYIGKISLTRRFIKGGK